MSQTVHYAHRAVKSKCTPIPCVLYGMSFDDRPDAAKRLEKARLARGFQTAKSASTFFGWEYDTYAQHENGNRGLSRAAKKYAPALGVSEAWLLTGEGRGPDAVPLMVPIIGHVRAGDDQIIYDEGQGPFDMVEAPPQSTPSTVAAVVRGGSMAGRADEGDLVYFDRAHAPATDALIGRLCVVGLPGGRIVVKKLHRTNGVWLLLSTNADPIMTEKIDWAAPVKWIKPK